MEEYGLSIGEGEGCRNDCFVGQSITSDKYNNMYDCDWNMNSNGIKSVVNKRNTSIVDLNSVARLPSIVIVEEEREANYPNFKEN